MRPAEMVIAETEVELTFHAVVFLGEAPGLTGKASVLVTHGAVLTLYKGGVETLTDG